MHRQTRRLRNLALAATLALAVSFTLGPAAALDLAPPAHAARLAGGAGRAAPPAFAYIMSNRYIMSNKSATEDQALLLGEVPPQGVAELKIDWTPNTSGLTGAGTSPNFARRWAIVERTKGGALVQTVSATTFASGTNAPAGTAKTLTIGGSPLTPGNDVWAVSQKGTAGYQIAEPGGALDLVLAYEEP